MKNKITLFILFIGITAFGQMENYDYKQQLQGIDGQWHKVVLPTDIYGKVSNNLSDIRIYGTNAANDTIEAPYLLRSKKETVISRDVNFKTINKSNNAQGYFFTYEVPTKESINQIKLAFNKNNFDVRVKLEGSQNQKEWFTLTEDYRLMSIQNNHTNYSYTDVHFPAAKYRYFRLLVNSKDDPALSGAKIVMNEIKEGTYVDYPIRSMNISEDKKYKRTEINIDLGKTVLLSQLQLKIDDQVDYWRPISIQYVSDSVKTEKGLIYQYKNLVSGTLTSIEDNAFKFDGRAVRKLKIKISNQDNTPLKIGGVTAKGFVQELQIRFADAGDYYLTYGNKKARRPNYDLARFADKVPNNLVALKLGPEIAIDKRDVHEVQPIFENKIWLWAVMALVIGLLGWFTLRMMREEGGNGDGNGNGNGN